MDKGAGTVRVSRKILLDEADAANDTLKAQAPTPEEVLSQLAVAPTFPVIPPRSFSQDYFLHNVASQEDLDNASNRLPTSEEIEASTNVGKSERHRRDRKEKSRWGESVDASAVESESTRATTHKSKSTTRQSSVDRAAPREHRRPTNQGQVKTQHAIETLQNLFEEDSGEDGLTSTATTMAPSLANESNGTDERFAPAVFSGDVVLNGRVGSCLFCEVI